jgi:hypothetical protein
VTRKTIEDRKRKSRINEREYRRLLRFSAQLDKMTEEQDALLKQLVTKQEAGETIAVADVPSFLELREMGVVKMQGGNVVVTALGYEVATYEEEAEAQ